MQKCILYKFGTFDRKPKSRINAHSHKDHKKLAILDFNCKFTDFIKKLSF